MSKIVAVAMSFNENDDCGLPPKVTGIAAVIMDNGVNLGSTCCKCGPGPSISMESITVMKSIMSGFINEIVENDKGVILVPLDEEEEQFLKELGFSASQIGDASEFSEAVCAARKLLL